jgi:Tripartite tricarboxylate transporter family receptor
MRKRCLLAPLLVLATALGCITVNAQSVPWPAFGPVRNLLRLDGFTDTVPDFIGPIDGSAQLTIFTEGNHYPVLLPLVLQRFPEWCRVNNAPIVQDLLTGQIAAGVIVVSNVLPQIQAGKLRALVTTAPKRASILPDVPRPAKRATRHWKASSGSGSSFQPARPLKSSLA